MRVLDLKRWSVQEIKKGCVFHMIAHAVGCAISPILEYENVMEEG